MNGGGWGIALAPQETFAAASAAAAAAAAEDEDSDDDDDEEVDEDLRVCDVTLLKVELSSM